MSTEQCPLELMCNCASAQCTTVHCAMSNVWRPTMCHCVTMQYPMSNVHLPDYGNVLQWWTTVLHSKQYPLRNVHLHIYLWQCPTMCHCTAPCVIVHIVQCTMSICDIVLSVVSHCTHCAICDVFCCEYLLPAQMVWIQCIAVCEILGVCTALQCTDCHNSMHTGGLHCNALVH